MSLWFAGDTGAVHRRGEMLYAVRPDGVRVVLEYEFAHPTSAAESQELMAYYGGSVHGIGHLLPPISAPLPGAVRAWGTVVDRPAEDWGPWSPTLITVDGRGHLALQQSFEESEIIATTMAGRHCTVWAPRGQEITLSTYPGEPHLDE